MRHFVDTQAGGGTIIGETEGPGAKRIKGAETGRNRIVQEPLGNVVMHTTPKTVSVVICYHPSESPLIMEDVGFERARALFTGDDRRHLGFRSTRERAELLEGAMPIESEKGKRTALSVLNPLGANR